MTGTGVPTWLDRLGNECDDTKRRMKALSAFIGTPEYHRLSHRMRSLLLRQGVVMGEYVSVMEERIQEGMRK